MSWTRGRNMTSWLFASGIGLLFVLAVAALVISLKVLHADEEAVEQRTISLGLETLFLSLVAAQNSVRGYIVTNNPNFLAPYHAELEKIRILQRDFDEYWILSKEELDTLKTQIAEHQKVLDSQIALTNSAGAKAAIMLVNGAGDRVRQIQISVRDLLVKVTKESDFIQSRWKSKSVALLPFIIISLLVSACLSLAQFILFRREISLQQTAEAALQAQRQSIEISSRFSETLQAAKSRDECYEIIQSYGDTIFQGNGGVLYVYNNSRDQLELATRWGGKEDDPVVEHFGPDECWALRRGRLYTGSEVEGQTDCGHHLNDHPRNYICLPITACVQTSGLLYLFTENSEHGVLDTLTEQAIMFTDHLSLALMNLQLSESLRNQAIRDSLTGLFNRRILDEILIREFALADRNKYHISFMMLDIDHFKKFNDTHGHGFGDQVIQKVAELISSMARQSDTVCRYGGEEFLIIFANCDPEQAVVKAEKIRLAVNALELDDTGSDSVSISVSIGIACYPDSADNKTDVIKLADEALYRAKRNGRDQVCVYEETPDEPEGMARLANVLSAGVKNAFG
ncbi:MAG: diguanylate cyclase [Alphaproteobacteria bacterium]